MHMHSYRREAKDEGRTEIEEGQRAAITRRQAYHDRRGEGEGQHLGQEDQGDRMTDGLTPISSEEQLQPTSFSFRRATSSSLLNHT